MSSSAEAPSPPGGGSMQPQSLGPFLKAIQTRDLEALTRLRHSLRTPASNQNGA